LDNWSKDSILPPGPQRELLIFRIGGEIAAFPLQSVQRIAPMAQLARPPGLPSPVEGILNLSGAAVPVIRLDRLLQLPALRLGLYSMLIVLKDIAAGPVAILVDRVNEILTVPEGTMLLVSENSSFNACAEAAVSVRGQTIHLLSPSRILLQKERESLAGFQAMAQERLKDWELRTQ
jgi:purine-binding chemotaxis protein CheW